MTGLPLLDFTALALSLFNAGLMLWLGLAVALNAERPAARPAWGAGLITLSLVLGALFFISHSALLVLDLNVLSRGLNFWWQAGWWPVLALPLAWYVLMLWYSGYWDERDTALRRRHRRWLPAAVGAALLLVLLVLFANPLPTLGSAARLAPLSVGGLPVIILAYPLYILLCIGLALNAILRPGPTGRLLGDAARRRARPWLGLGSALLLLVSFLVTWVMLWFAGRLARAPGQLLALDPATVFTIALFDLAILGLISLALLLLGQALVAYEVFTGKSLPRRGLLRFWRSAILLCAGYAVIAAGSLILDLRPIYIVLLSLTLLSVAYALFSWRAYADRERQMRQLRPFVLSQQLYEQLQEQAATHPQTPTLPHPHTTLHESFHALCRDVLGARLAYLVPLGAAATLAGPPLTYPPSASMGIASTFPLDRLDQLVSQTNSPPPFQGGGAGGGRSLVEIDPAEFGGAQLALPLHTASPARLIGLLLLGEKSDGGLYAQEEIDLARAAGESLLDALASAEVARRLLLLQRQRLAETHIADQHTRRVLHDDVLPLLHAALLQLHTPAPASSIQPPASEASTLLTSAHRRLADLLRELPAAAAPDVARLGLVDALRRLLAGELAHGIDAVEWDLAPEAEARAQALPPLAADVLYSAAREALRNTARHARRPEAPLRVTVTLAPAGASGLELILQDDGLGLGAENGRASDSTGQGLALHGALLGMVGGTLSVESEAGAGTRVRLTLH